VSARDEAAIRAAVILGTRPEAIKLFPLIRELGSDARFAVEVVVTGQHREMLDQILGPFGIVPDASLEIMRHDQSLNSIVTRVMPLLDELYRRSRPDVVLVQGDTTSAFCAALAAFHLGIPVGHVEAGLRSGDRFHPYPEEVNRRMLSSAADLHFAPTAGAAERLLAEGVPADAVFVTGNTIVDALLATLADESLLARHRVAGLPPRDGPLVLITLHRRESWAGAADEPDADAATPLERVLLAVADAAERRPDASFVFPVHLNPRVRAPVGRILDGRPNVHLLDPLPYIPFVELMRRAAVILTDSGGIQEEAPSLGIPVLVARRTTERPEGLAAASNRLVGTGRVEVREALVAALAAPPPGPDAPARPNPFGDGQASRRIRCAILSHFGRMPRPDNFGSVQARASRENAGRADAGGPR